ncbi:MAG: hypothetical protein ACTSUE_23840 [Promethearchaeota archaeon]
MNLIELMELFPKKDYALLLRCLLDRVPIIIGGNDRLFVDEIILQLCNTVEIRKEIVFGTDFLEDYEYDAIIQEENVDYDNPRAIFRAPVNSEDLILERIRNLKGWIIGLCYNGDVDSFFEKSQRLRALSTNSLFIKFDDSNNLEFVKIYGDFPNKFNTDLEKRFINITFSQTESSLERINRVIEKKIHNSDLNESILESLIDLSQEEIIIKDNIFKKEVTEFYNAARRGLALLSRLNFLNQFQEVKIGKRTFFEAISYSSVNSKRFLEFIKAEWNENFENLLDSRLLTILGDHLDSLWG